MSDINNFTTSAMDWRKQLKQNQRRTTYVIGMFLLLYMCVGLLIDTYLHLSPATPTITDTLTALLTLQIIPKATLVMLAIALISLWITFSFYDRLMLLGTEYHEVDPQHFASLEEQQLYNVVEEMKVAAGLKFMPKVFIIDADYMNAFASGYSEKSAMVAITRGLMQKLTRAEMQAVMAHELSHVRHGDIKLTLMASVLSNLMLIAIDVLFYSVIFGRGDDEGDRRNGNQLALVIIVLRYLLPIITVLLTFYLSRTREYMADAGCVELMRDNQPLASALLKIHQDSMANADLYRGEYSATAHEDVRRAAYLYDPAQAGLEPMKSIAGLFSTHPDIKDRLSALGVKQK